MAYACFSLPDVRQALRLRGTGRGRAAQRQCLGSVLLVRKVQLCCTRARQMALWRRLRTPHGHDRHICYASDTAGSAAQPMGVVFIRCSVLRYRRVAALARALASSRLLGAARPSRVEAGTAAPATRRRRVTPSTRLADRRSQLRRSAALRSTKRSALQGWCSSALTSRRLLP
jgi:hypothetical protein